jgi:hypothetical protein
MPVALSCCPPRDEQWYVLLSVRIYACKMEFHMVVARSRFFLQPMTDVTARRLTPSPSPGSSVATLPNICRKMTIRRMTGNTADGWVRPV